MKNLKTLIAALGFGALSILPSFGQDSTKVNNSSTDRIENFFKIGVGNYMWYDNDIKDAYGNLFMIKPAYERFVTGNIALEISPSIFFAKKDKIDDTSYKFSNFSTDLGIDKLFAISEDNSIYLYLKAGFRYATASESVTTTVPSASVYGAQVQETNTEKGSGLGYYFGGGFGLSLGPGAFLYGEINLNSQTLELYNTNLDMGGAGLTVGVEFY